MRRVFPVLVVASSVGVLIAPNGAVGRVACGSPAAPTVVQGRDSRVYKRKVRNGTRPFQLFACTRGAAPTSLDDPRDNAYAFGAPAIAVTGPLVGYAQTSLDDEGTDFETAVLVVDLRHPDEPKRFAPASRASPAAKVGSLVMSQAGAIAWIACPETDSPAVGSRSPTCIRPGASDRVYRLNSNDKRAALLDKGRSIDPASLSIRGSRVRWSSHGNRQSAQLK